MTAWDRDSLDAPHTRRELGIEAQPTWADRCRDCFQPEGTAHLHWCPEVGTVTKAQTNGGPR